MEVRIDHDVRFLTMVGNLIRLGAEALSCGRRGSGPAHSGERTGHFGIDPDRNANYGLNRARGRISEPLPAREKAMEGAILNNERRRCGHDLIDHSNRHIAFLLRNELC